MLVRRSDDDYCYVFVFLISLSENIEKSFHILHICFDKMGQLCTGKMG